MSTLPAVFDVGTLKDKVSEKIKSAFVELIPEEQWKQLVSNEINRFTCKERDYSGEKPSILSTMINEAIRERFKAKIQEALNGNGFDAMYDSMTGKDMASTVAKEIAVQYAPQIVESLMSNLIQTAINRLRSDLQNNSY